KSTSSHGSPSTVEKRRRRRGGCMARWVKSATPPAATATPAAAQAPATQAARRQPSVARIELVADVPHRFDQLLPFRTQLGADAPDVHVHRARAPKVIIPPDLVQERLAREDAPPMADQEAEQLVLLEGEFQGLPARGDAVVRLVDDQVAGEE